MEIINNTHIELTKIVKYKGIYYNAKVCLYVADIVRVEASKRLDIDETCTRIVLGDEYFFKVTEKYKKVRNIWLEWIKNNQDESKSISSN